MNLISEKDFRYQNRFPGQNTTKHQNRQQGNDQYIAWLQEGQALSKACRVFCQLGWWPEREQSLHCPQAVLPSGLPPHHESSRDCCSRKALPHRHLAGHCFKNSLCWTFWLPRLLTPTRDDNEQVAWENRKTRAEPRNLVLGLKLPTETEIILFPNNIIPSVDDFLVKDAIF